MRRRAGPLLLGALLAPAALLPAGPARAQSAESEPAPEPGTFEPGKVPQPGRPYVIPDVPPEITKATQIHVHWFTMKPGVELMLDYDWFGQDDVSIAQVGPLEDQWDERSVRAKFRGTLGEGYKVHYLLSVEHKGFATEPGEEWTLTDLSFTFPLGGPETQLTIGKTKETFVYEMVAEAPNKPQQERVLSPFFVSRNIGAKITHVFGETHWGTAALGVFNDWWSTGDDLEDSGTDVTGRITALLWDNHPRRRFLHVAVGARYAGADNDTLRYKGRPESNVTPNYVDTGDLIGDHGMHLGLEALFNEGPFSILAEYAHAWVHSPGSGDPEFSGWYVLGSYVLTGETRHYDRTLAYARRIMPEHHWGAPEILVEYSTVDLDDGAVQGGSFRRVGFGVNWWATRRAKIGFSYGHIELDRFGTEGGTDAYQARLQWVY